MSSSERISKDKPNSADVHVCPRAIKHWNRSPGGTRNSLPAPTVLPKPLPRVDAGDVCRVEVTELVRLRRDSLKKVEGHLIEWSPTLITTEQTFIFEDQRLLLRGFQTVQALDKVLGQGFVSHVELHILLPSSVSKTSRQLSRGDVQKMAFLRDKLKGQLDHRCFVGLRRECAYHINLLKKFVDELKRLYRDERSKLKEPNTKHKRIMGDEIYFGRKQKLFDHLNAHAGHWSLILQKVNRMVSVFHIRWDTRLRTLLGHVEKTMERLRVKAHNWTRAILLVDLLILCLQEQEGIPSDLLQNFYLSLEAYKVIGGEELLTPCSCRCFLCFDSPLDSSYLLQRLARCQAVRASGVLLDSLRLECKSEGSSPRSWLSHLNQEESKRNVQSSSDYYTLSDSGSDLPGADSLTEGPFFSSLMETSQTSLLKHLFAMSHLQAPQRLKRKKRYNVSRSLWSVGKPYSEGCYRLEKIYWSHFWKGLEEWTWILAWYGPQTFLLLEQSLQGLLFDKCQQLNSSADLCTEASEFLKHLAGSLSAQSCYRQWDQGLCCSLSSANGQRMWSLLLVDGTVGSNLGKVIYETLDPALALTLTSQHLSLSTGVLCLQSTLDHLLLWSRTRLVNLLTSWNVTMYLTFSLADLNQIMEALEVVSDLRTPEGLGGFWALERQKQLIQVMVKQIPDELTRVCYLQARKLFQSSMPKKKYWRRKERRSSRQYVNLMISELLGPALEVMVKVKYWPSALPIVLALTDTLIHSWINYFINNNVTFSASGVHQLSIDYEEIRRYCEDSQLEEELKRAVLSGRGFTRMQQFLKYLSSAAVRRRWFGRNRVEPQSGEELVEEKWRSMRSHAYLSMLCC